MSFSLIKESFLSTYKFRIGFDNISTYENNYETIYSEEFVCGNTKWKVGLNPNGTSENRGRTVVTLIYCSSGPAVIDISFGLQNQNKMYLHKSQKLEKTLFNADNTIIELKDFDLTYNSLLRATTAEARTRSIDNIDKLFLEFDLTVYAQNKEIEVINWWKNIADMIHNNATADVVLRVDGASIPAHRMILCVKSVVFRVMFDSHMKESSTNEIVITDFTEDLVRSMLRCIYDPTAIDFEFTTHSSNLWAIVHKFEVTDVMDMIEKKMTSTLTYENAINTLQFADCYGLSALKTAAMDVMVVNCKKVFCTESLPSLLGDQLCGDLFTYLATHCTVTSNTKKEEIFFFRKASKTFNSETSLAEEYYSPDDYGLNSMTYYTDDLH